MKPYFIQCTIHSLHIYCAALLDIITLLKMSQKGFF